MVLGSGEMILNVSGRTDIVAFYSEWFMKRYKEGFVDVRNPFNPKMVSRIFLMMLMLLCFVLRILAQFYPF